MCISNYSGQSGNRVGCQERRRRTFAAASNCPATNSLFPEVLASCAIFFCSGVTCDEVGLERGRGGWEGGQINNTLGRGSTPRGVGSHLGKKASAARCIAFYHHREVSGLVVRAIRHACSPRITGTLNLHRTQTSCRPSSCSWEPSLVCGGRGGSAGLWRVEAIDWEFSCFFPPPKKFQSLAKQKRHRQTVSRRLVKEKGQSCMGK